MTQTHPELEAEQAYVEHAYDCLETSRVAAWRMRDMHEADLGGTFQARFERNAVDEALVKRLTELDLGNAALVFGRIDRESPDVTAPETFHIGRLAVADEDREPVVIDWRAPVAEPFYRATGRDPMGLVRRRHFVVDGRQVLGLEDELFGDGHLGVGVDDGLASSPRANLRGYSTLIASLERGRTGTLGDIVATIQAEQDEIIRSPQAGVLVVQGGPGTGKTVVALHRAAYLLYTHRFPLEDQGVLVVGPNRVFLRYIEQVLPSLGEAGIEQVVLADLVPDVRCSAPESEDVARVKGSDDMSRVIDRAIRDRERPIREDVTFPFRSGYVRLRAAEVERIVRGARRGQRRHNAARRHVEHEIWSALAANWHDADVSPLDVRDELRGRFDVRELLERVWPVLTPAELLHDLFGSRALLRSAGRGVLTDDEIELLYRARSPEVADVSWTVADAALLDDAREALGPKVNRAGKIDDADEIRTYGHIVVDEVQDLSPMELKMVARRSLNGSLTVVGDIAQATGPSAPRHWDDVLQYLPSRREPRVIGLSVGYRIPAQIMELANRVMRVAAPGLRAPESVRVGESDPLVVCAGTDIHRAVVREAAQLANELSGGSIAIVAADDECDDIAAALDEAGVAFGRAASGLAKGITLVPVSVVKGLELDGVIVVEPASIVASSTRGMRSLFVALTRSTRRLVVVHAQPLPASMQPTLLATS